MESVVVAQGTADIVLTITKHTRVKHQRHRRQLNIEMESRQVVICLCSQLCDRSCEILALLGGIHCQCHDLTFLVPSLVFVDWKGGFVGSTVRQLVKFAK